MSCSLEVKCVLCVLTELLKQILGLYIKKDLANGRKRMKKQSTSFLREWKESKRHVIKPGVPRLQTII